MKNKHGNFAGWPEYLPLIRYIMIVTRMKPSKYNNIMLPTEGCLINSMLYLREILYLEKI